MGAHTSASVEQGVSRMDDGVALKRDTGPLVVGRVAQMVAAMAGWRLAEFDDDMGRPMDSVQPSHRVSLRSVGGPKIELTRNAVPNTRSGLAWA